MNGAGSSSFEDNLRGCTCCGLVQRVPKVTGRMRVTCARCHTPMAAPDQRRRSNSPSAAFAVAALILYPLAIWLPVMRIEQFGHRNETSILAGTASLLANGYMFIGLIVLTCSIILPLAKLGALLVLTGAPGTLGHRHRALTYRMVEWTGRWGMLDVLVVAIVVAWLKLGDIVDVTPGPGAVAFATVVLLSLLAAATFDPHISWPMRPSIPPLGDAETRRQPEVGGAS